MNVMLSTIQIHTADENSLEKLFKVKKTIVNDQ